MLAFVKKYWFELFLFLIFIVLILFFNEWHWMIPMSFVWWLLVAFLLWFSSIKKYKLYYPLIMMLILIIPTWVIGKRFPMFFLLEMLPCSYIVFAFWALLQLIEIWIINKLMKQKNAIPKRYIISVILILLLWVCVPVISFYVMW